jgi:hypothetical protein
MSELFEIVVFTASQKVYASKLLGILDPDCYIEYVSFQPLAPFSLLLSLLSLLSLSFSLFSLFSLPLSSFSPSKTFVS